MFLFIDILMVVVAVAIAVYRLQCVVYVVVFCLWATLAIINAHIPLNMDDTECKSNIK